MTAKASVAVVRVRVRLHSGRSFLTSPLLAGSRPDFFRVTARFAVIEMCLDVAEMRIGKRYKLPISYTTM